MGSAKQWAWSITCNSVVAALFYFWQVRGIENAHNLLMFIVWVLIVMTFIATAASIEAKKKKELPLTPPALKLFSRVCTAALIGSLVWFGHPFAATCFLIAWVCLLCVVAPDSEPS